jgi:DNA-binding transcriptional ArsR family regulator
MRNPLQWWRARRAIRRARDEALVAGVLWHTPDLPGWSLIRDTGLSPGRVYVALARLEGDGRVTARRADGPYPRRRLYRLAGEDGRQ